MTPDFATFQHWASGVYLNYNPEKKSSERFCILCQYTAYAWRMTYYKEWNIMLTDIFKKKNLFPLNQCLALPHATDGIPFGVFNIETLNRVVFYCCLQETVLKLLFQGCRQDGFLVKVDGKNSIVYSCFCRYSPITILIFLSYIIHFVVD